MAIYVSSGPGSTNGKTHQAEKSSRQLADLSAEELVSRLNRAKDADRRELMVFRENRQDALKQYVGARYSENGAPKEVIVNLIGLYVQVISRHLISADPRVMMGTFQSKIKPSVNATEKWANNRMRRMKISKTLERCAVDGLFLQGICKVGITKPSEAALGGYSRMAGEPYASPVDYDDWVQDTRAKCPGEFSYCGHRYVAPLEAIKDSKLYDKVRKRLTPRMNESFNREGDSRIGELSRGSYAGEDEFEDMVELWEYYLPRRKLIVTMHDDFDIPLRVEPWVGPECGPYYFFSLGDVPGSSIPKSPIMDLMPLHEGYNGMARKAFRQASRQKTILEVPSGDSEDAKRVNETPDGGACRVNGAGGMKEIRYGGPDAPLIGFSRHVKDLFDWAGQNISVLGGMAKQSNTASQDQMLEKNASMGVAFMQQRMVSFTEEIVRGLCWYWWNDPYSVMKSTFELGNGSNLSLERLVTPQQRAEGKFEELDIDVDPYSLRQDSPQSRMAALDQTVFQVVVPLYGLLQKQGYQFEIGKYLELKAKYLNMPDLQDIITLGAPQLEGDSGAGGGESPTRPGQTTRSYERMDRGNPDDGQAEITAMLSGGGNGMEEMGGDQ